MFNFKQYDWRKYNFSLLIIMIILCVCSAYFVSFAIGEDKADSYFKRQIFAMIGGLVLAVFVSLLDYRRVCDWTIVYYVIGTVMVAATKLSPLGTDQSTGSYRWLKFPGINFQPSEICKIVVNLVLAVYFTRVKDKMDSWKTLLIGFAIMFLPTFFIV